MRAPFAVSLALALALLPLAAGLAAAQEDVPVPGPTPTPAATPVPHKSGIVGIDAMTSTVFQEGQSSFSGVALRLRLRDSNLVPNIEFLPTFEYWQNTSTLDAFGIKTQRRDATLGIDARWVFEHAGWRPYAGFGLGLHFLNNDLRMSQSATQPTPVHASDALVKGGTNALLGVNFGLSERLGSFVELKLLGVSKYRQVKFNTGISWNL